MADDTITTGLEISMDVMSLQDDTSLRSGSVSPDKNSLLEVILDQNSPRPELIKEKPVFRDDEVDELLDWSKFVREPISTSKDLNIDLKSCSPNDFLSHGVFPVLLPALDNMITEAKKSQVFERKRTKFNACDSITEYLYKNNPLHEEKERKESLLNDIPFVKDILAKKPRHPLPLSLQWSEEEAAVKIESFWRGYQVRKRDDVAELREYQKEMREASYHIMDKVDEFWRQHPVE